MVTDGGIPECVLETLETFSSEGEPTTKTVILRLEARLVEVEKSIARFHDLERIGLAKEVVSLNQELATWRGHIASALLRHPEDQELAKLVQEAHDGMVEPKPIGEE